MDTPEYVSQIQVQFSGCWVVFKILHDYFNNSSVTAIVRISSIRGLDKLNCNAEPYSQGPQTSTGSLGVRIRQIRLVIDPVRSLISGVMHFTPMHYAKWSCDMVSTQSKPTASSQPALGINLPSRLYSLPRRLTLAILETSVTPASLRVT